MDRQMIYPGAIPLETDLLNAQKNSMIGLSKLAVAILGASTFINGLACAPDSPASLNVSVGAGEIYSLQNIDGTAYSSLAADTTHQIVKQGIRLDSGLLSCPAPATAGQSINYLVQVAYQDTDANAVVLPYYNASNPAQAYSGPNNSGTAQNTVRKGVCTVAVKAGIAATTGSQTTPAPDAGYIGAWVVTVANGQTTITAPNISVYPGAPFLPADGFVAGGFQKQAFTAFTTAGAAPNFSLTPSPAITAYAADRRFRVKFHAAGAGADQMNISGLGNKALKQYDNTGAKIAAIIAANQLADVEYDGVDLVVLDPLPSAYGLPLSGGTMSGAINMGGNAISNASNLGASVSGLVSEALDLQNTSAGGGKALISLFSGTIGNAVAGDLLLSNSVGNLIISPNAAGKTIKLVPGVWTNPIAAEISATGLSVTGSVAATTTLKSGGYTVATLPAGSAGMQAYVTDALNPAWNTALTGGGAVVCPVFYGTAWQATVSPASLGVGQTWQNVAGARAIGTAYQNTTGQPIELSININSTTNSKLEVSADNVTYIVVGSFANSTSANITFNQTAIVPNGHWYRATQTGTIGTWAELR